MRKKKELTHKEVASMGGRKVVEVYGREHMAKIAKSGNAGIFGRDREAQRRASALGVAARLRKKALKQAQTQ